MYHSVNRSDFYRFSGSTRYKLYHEIDFKSDFNAIRTNRLSQSCRFE